MERAYYKAYDDRYRQVHEKGLQWFDKAHSPILEETVRKYVKPLDSILEIGCGEGRDAAFLLSHGYNVRATDVSSEAISFC